jgi:Ca2+-binding RTX toxin-like protein
VTSPDTSTSTTSSADPQVCEPPQPIGLGATLWQLEADSGRIELTANAWREYARQARAVAQDVTDVAGRLYGDGWVGQTADTYDEHRRKLTGDIQFAADLAGQVADEMEQVASLLRAGQSALDQSLYAVTSIVPAASGADGTVMFYPNDDNDAELVRAAVRDAQNIRAGLDDQLLDPMVALEHLVSDWNMIAQSLESKLTGGVQPFTLPPEAAGATYVIRDGDNVIINTGTGNDKVLLLVNPLTGDQIVMVNGTAHTYPADAHVTIRSGQGNDEVTVASGTQVRVTLLGGAGDDTLRGGAGDDRILGGSGGDNLYGGKGDDRVSGGAGRDYIDGYSGDDILAGGLGDDTVYGLSGNDALSGGEGRDYLEGGTGADTLSGGAGNDMMSGGRGDDVLRGGAGDDRTYAGFGTDTVDGGTGNDTSYGQTDDKVTGAEREVTVELTDVGGYIKVEGSPEFVERVQADLDMLRSSPRGQDMLESLESAHERTRSSMADTPVIGGWFDQGDTLTIREFTPPPGVADNSYASRDIDPDESNRQMLVQYQTSFDTLYDGPPVTILYHELAHVYDYTNETLASGTHAGPDNIGVNNLERVAAGLPIDHDNNPATPIQIDPRHPIEFTENGLRDEMGAPPRPRY